MMPAADQNLSGVSAAQRPVVSTLVQRFEEAWHQWPPPSLDDFLPPDSEERRAALRQLASIDLAHDNLGEALLAKEEVDDAIPCFKKAIELDPKLASAHNNLGLALNAEGHVNSAIHSYRMAIDLNPKLAAAHDNLGDALKSKGDLDGAIRSYHRAVDLEPKKPRGPSPPCQRPGCQDSRIFRGQVPARRRNGGPPVGRDVSAALADARHRQPPRCQCLRRRPETCRKPAGETHRYNAACSAVLAAAGKGADAAKLDAKQRAVLRRLALGWLQADLQAWTIRLADTGSKDR
jgi:tetratricopeptide (TPR) repeat protein